jgi:outer membrane biosynthesis protein TonB
MKMTVKCTLILSLLAIFTSNSFAQNKSPKPKVKVQQKKKNEKHVEEKSGNFRVIESQEAHYNGTEEEMVLFFMQNIYYDSLAVRANAEGQAIISFTVNADSSISNPTIIQKFGYNVDEQLIPIVSRLKFIPAQMNGVVIRSNHIISIPLRAYFH